ncbi:MAG: DUF1501 domain-containing protein [Planctomycetes bacterium]|nr:DUF1501 domain-containing protein [Planctomycetota bacterium]MCB9917962.1 DUF1501 domain-containing protein [Planctomycetota bacterium]
MARSDVSRRAFLAHGSAASLAAALPFSSRRSARREAEPRADTVIQIFLQGGLSAQESFDPKPQAPIEYRGEVVAINTAIDGVQFGSALRRTAKLADRISVIRSMTHTEAAHERGTHGMLTGYPPSPALTYPSLGAVVAHELGGREALPPYVSIPDANEPYLGTGYLSSAFAAFAPGGDPGQREFRVRDLDLPTGVSLDRSARRRAILQEFDSTFEERHPAVAESDAVAATNEFYEQAFELAGSDEAKLAFRIDKESSKVRDAYGRTGIGQRLLLARRLATSGVRWVTVRDTGWDHHQRIATTIAPRLEAFDRAFAALLSDLEQRGRLDRTLVIVMTEFGRTPRLNADAGRDHWPRVFSIALAGGGIAQGRVLGASDEVCAAVASDPVSPRDLATTTLHLVGLDLEKRLMAPGGRPVQIVRDGRILREILA